MTSLTLSVSEELRKKMEEHPEINWSEVARQAIILKITLLEKMDKILKNSKLTEKDAIKIGRKVNAGIAKKMGFTK